MSAVIDRILSFGKQYGIVWPGLLMVMGGSALGFLIFRHWFLLIIPFVLAGFAWGVQDFRRLYLIMWATIPVSLEIDLPGGLSTDLPAEPLMWILCLLLAGYIFLYYKEIDFRFLLHPLTVLLAIHLFWIVWTTIISDAPVISIKYSLAKTWYLITFILIPLILFKKAEDFKILGAFLLIPLLLTIIIILIRHSQSGFTFSTINQAVMPIYRNHVDYACALGVTFPFIIFLRHWFTGYFGKFLFVASILLIAAGIYFSYTRAAWMCIPLTFILYYIVKLRLMRILIPVALGIAILVAGWLSYDNRYLDFAPEYEKAISHQRFDELISATYKMEDISTVERFYRWVAGYYMIKENPWTGFGPASFYSFYHQFADRHFTTYVSDNPEKSGMHNYYLMIAVEQGIIGLGIFLILVISVLLYGERLYQRLSFSHDKSLLLAALISFGCNLFVLTLNDMVETDKLGSFFFISIAIVILFGTKKDMA